MSDKIFVTPGSCGTTTLLGKFREISSTYLKDVHVHERDAKKVSDENPSGKVIYLFANPYDTLISYARRYNFLLFASFNLGCEMFMKSEDHKLKKIFTEQPDFFEKNDWEYILETYLDLNQDTFNLKHHYDQWKNTKINKLPTRFIRYEGLLEGGLHLFQSWWNCDVLKGHRFQNVPRRSNYDNLSSTLKNKLEKMYGDWFNQYYSLPEVEDVKG